jgi:hypothetical protein
MIRFFRAIRGHHICAFGGVILSFLALWLTPLLAGAFETGTAYCEISKITGFLVGLGGVFLAVVGSGLWVASLDE